MISEEAFRELFEGVERVIVKPRYGMRGDGIRIEDLDDLRELWRRLREEKDVIVEEYVKQRGFLNELNPDTMNTLRVITYRMPDRIVVGAAFLRVGGPGALTDNMHQGGVAMLVRFADGKLDHGNLLTKNGITRHPQTGIRLSGLTVPRWREIQDFCVKAHGIAPEGLDRIGWDVCLDGERLLMIEGNEGPGHGPWLPGNPDCWKLTREYLDAKLGKNGLVPLK